MSNELKQSEEVKEIIKMVCSRLKDVLPYLKQISALAEVGVRATPTDVDDTALVIFKAIVNLLDGGLEKVTDNL